MSPLEMVQAIQKKTLYSRLKISQEIGITHTTMVRISREQRLKPLTICKIERYYERVMDDKSGS
jgi:DNA-binding XRE family transcriptional regulator